MPGPTTYGPGCTYTDKSQYVCGTSISSPMISAGLMEIAARYNYKGNVIYHMNTNTWTCGIRAGAWYLAQRSNSPDGRGVTPSAAKPLGAVSDHDAWYQDSWTPTC